MGFVRDCRWGNVNITNYVAVLFFRHQVKYGVKVQMRRTVRCTEETTVSTEKRKAGDLKM